MKTSGYTTSNENGVFELTWEDNPSFFKKIFNIKTKHKYVCYDLDKENLFVWCDRYHGLQWFDDKGNFITCNYTLDKINEVLTELVLKEFVKKVWI